MVKQAVVRTYSTKYVETTRDLEAYLNAGWVVKHITNCNEYTEYIVEKEENSTKGD